ncbi:MAG: hypothetical protein E7158_05755 [Firmicutes bacterium]|nr:hypothetical protein [Bacillota bacterium]
MKKNRLKLKRSIKISKIIYILLFLIFINVAILLDIFNNAINPKLETVVNMDIDKMIDNLITEYSLKEDYETMKDILIINKNRNGEIINIDYNLKALYNFSLHITDELKNDLYDLQSGKTNSEFYDEYLSSNKDYFVLMVPIGMASNNIYFSNLGPKVPVKIKFIGSILTGVKTKIKDYGINNSLIEVYTNVNISTLVLTPVSKKRVNRNFKILVASKVIQGKIPELYGGILEQSSNLKGKKIE